MHGYLRSVASGRTRENLRISREREHRTDEGHQYATLAHDGDIVAVGVPRGNWERPRLIRARGRGNDRVQRERSNPRTLICTSGLHKEHKTSSHVTRHLQGDGVCLTAVRYHCPKNVATLCGNGQPGREGRRERGRQWTSAGVGNVTTTPVP